MMANTIESIKMLHENTYDRIPLRCDLVFSVFFEHDKQKNVRIKKRARYRESLIDEAI